MWKLGQNGEKNWFGGSCAFLVAEETQVPAFPQVSGLSHQRVALGSSRQG